MKISILLFVLITLAITSCAQEQKKTGQTSDEKNTQAPCVKIEIPVDGMVCSACQSTVKKTVKSLNGVKNAEVSLENKSAFITYNPNLIKPEQIQKAINDKGYSADKPQEVKQ